MTKKYKTAYRVCAILSLLSVLSPLFYFVIKGFLTADVVYEKVTLTTTLFVALILTVIGLLNKVTYRSKLWIVLIGLYISLKSIMLPLVLIACGQILDELILSPAKAHYKNLYTINREIDKRG